MRWNYGLHFGDNNNITPSPPPPPVIIIGVLLMATRACGATSMHKSNADRHIKRTIRPAFVYVYRVAKNGKNTYIFREYEKKLTDWS